MSLCTGKPADMFCDQKLLCLSTVPLGESRLTSAMTSSPPPPPVINDSCAIPPTSQLTTPPHQPSLGHNGISLVTVCSCRYCCLITHSDKDANGRTDVVVKEPYHKQNVCCLVVGKISVTYCFVLIRPGNIILHDIECVGSSYCACIIVGSIQVPQSYAKWQTKSNTLRTDLAYSSTKLAKM